MCVFDYVDARGVWYNIFAVGPDEGHDVGNGVLRNGGYIVVVNVF